MMAFVRLWWNLHNCTCAPFKVVTGDLFASQKFGALKNFLGLKPNSFLSQKRETVQLSFVSVSKAYSCHR